jgi:ABC-type multidrug transport system fused ATPase/permease subunit
MGSKQNWETIWFFLRPYKVFLLFLLITSISCAILETLNVAILYPILNGTLGIEPDQSNFFLGIISNVVDLFPVEDIVIANSIVFIILTVLFFALKMVYLVASLKITSKIVVDSNTKYFRNIVNSDYQSYCRP